MSAHGTLKPSNLVAAAGEWQPGSSQESAAREAGTDVQTLGSMQERLRGALAGDAGAISAIRIMHLYLERLGIDFKVPAWPLIAWPHLLV